MNCIHMGRAKSAASDKKPVSCHVAGGSVLFWNESQIDGGKSKKRTNPRMWDGGLKWVWDKYHNGGGDKSFSQPWHWSSSNLEKQKKEKDTKIQLEYKEYQTPIV